MRKILMVWLLVIIASTPAAARWFHYRHHHHHWHHGETSSAINPQGQDGYAREHTLGPREMAPDQAVQQSRVPVGVVPAGQPPDQPPAGQASSTEENTTGDLLLPQGWQRQPADPNWRGQRFLSPDGMGSFSAYITPVAQEPIAEHMKAVAFHEGEQITRLRGGRSWIEVAGFKGSRIFYRKSVLACGGTSWHEVAFEYPAEAHGMGVFVDSVAAGVETNRDKGCAAAVASSDASSNGGDQPATDQNTNHNSNFPSDAISGSEAPH